MKNYKHLLITFLVLFLSIFLMVLVKINSTENIESRLNNISRANLEYINSNQDIVLKGKETNNVSIIFTEYNENTGEFSTKHLIFNN